VVSFINSITTKDYGDLIMKRLLAGLLCVTGFMFGWFSVAGGADLPGTVQPGQIEKQFRPEPKIPAAQPERMRVMEQDQPIPSDAKEIRFALKSMTVEGATVYTQKELLSPYGGRLGAEISLYDVYQIASELTAKYRNDGFILSRVIVPAQTIENGEVHLKAVEGYIARVTVEGGSGDWRKKVEGYAEKIRQSRPLKSSVLERYMLFINDLPGASARATLKPSRSEPAASDMFVQFMQQKVQGGAAWDNRGGESLGPNRISGDLTLNSVLGLQESTTLRAVISGDKKLKYGYGSHEIPIGPDGGKLTVSADAVESTPKERAFIPLNLETSGQTGTIMYSYPFIRSRAENLSVRGGMYGHDGKTKIFDVEDTRDHIRAFKLGVTYDRADLWWGVNFVDLELSHGIKGLGSSKNGDSMLSRADGRVDFTKVTMYAARLQALTERFSLLAAINGQYAFNNLLSSELFSFGGEQFGRGYDPSELVGDHGLAGKLELRFTDTLPFSPSIAYTFYGFYDIGVVYHRSYGDADRSESGASAGIGLRLNLGPYFSCFGELAKPLTRAVAAEENRLWRGYAGVSMRF
jgi:hemolysin activation/secretion protein